MKKSIISIILTSVFIITALASPAAAYQPYTAVYEFGDVNNDGNIAAGDALLALQCSVKKIALDYDEQDAADVDENWEITAADALMILQKSVNKIELTKKTNPYDEYKLKYVEPTGLSEYILYMVSSTLCLTDLNTGKNYDLMRFIVSIQGLINRNNDKHHVAVSLRLDGTDNFWLSYMMEEGATYADYTVSEITSTTQMLDTFAAFIRECGLIIWDPNVPSTANVAGTICGLYNYLPVQYSTEDGSLYKILTEDYNVPIKMDLCGKFEDAKLGEKIKGTQLDSTGSAKNDAYIWAMDQYMDECNPELLAYTLDGASSVMNSDVQKGGSAYSAQITGIPNHDYFILNQCFFFDLTSYSGEAATDDITQPVGTDAATLKKILQKRYDMANGNFGMVIGFPPWHVKYTNSISINTGSLDPPRLEWHFVETCVSYNCGIEADAPNPCWLSNASLYTKYTLRNEAKSNTPAKDIEYDPDTYYFTQCYAGDFDCSPWLKMRVPGVWNDAKLGEIPMTFNYSTTLIERIPMVFDYVFEHQNENTYLTTGEGSAYVMTSALFNGFKGKEARPTTRTLTSGDRAYIHYIKPYISSQKLDIYGMMINGFSVAGAQDFNLMKYLAPNGGLLQNSAAGGNNVNNYNGTPYVRVGGISGSDDEMRNISLRSAIKSAKEKFVAVGYFNKNENIGTPSSFSAFMTSFNEYMSWRDPDLKYQYVDIETFFALLAESGKGTVVN